jgi:hypothetical protein
MPSIPMTQCQARLKKGGATSIAVAGRIPVASVSVAGMSPRRVRGRARTLGCRQGGTLAPARRGGALNPPRPAGVGGGR